MADVRSLLKNERAARKIQHKYASYSTTGTLSCRVCHLQLKSESLWEGHLRSPGHIMRQQKLEDQATSPVSEVQVHQTKKRKADDEEDAQATIHKRSRQANSLPEGFFDVGIQEAAQAVQPPLEMHIPSRPATPAKPSPSDSAFPAKKPEPAPQINEDEWAAFEADIAAADAPVDSDAVISAPAMSAEELKKKSAEEQYAMKKERQEAEIEGEKEDAVRKLEEQLEEMEGLEARVRRLREKREELRKKESMIGLNKPVVVPVQRATPIAEEDEDDSEDDDEWAGFRMNG